MFEEKIFIMVESQLEGAKDLKVIHSSHAKAGINFYADLVIDNKVKELRRNGASNINVWWNFCEESAVYCVIQYREDGDLSKKCDRAITCFLGTPSSYRKAFNV